MFLFLCTLVIAESVLVFKNLPKATTTAATTQTGKLVVSVLETNTLTPIDNATVCVIETRKYYQTNKKGLTENIVLPVIVNPNFNVSAPQTWGEVTLLVYKNGYADAICFRTKIYPNTTRVGCVVFLPPIINDGDNQPIINQELPPDEYIRDLIRLFKK